MVLAGVLLLALWLAWALTRDSSLSRVQQAGVLRVAYAVEPPYAWVAADGAVGGESPQTAQQVAQRLGLARVEWVQVPFADLIPGLLAGRFDVVAAGLFVTEARARQVRFSDPTVRVLPALLVARGNPRGLTSYRALGTSTVRVAVIEGSVEQSRLQALGLAGDRLVAVPDAQTGRAALAAGSVDALALSLPTLTWMARQQPGSFDVLPDTGSAGDRVAFAFRPDAAALQQAWNQAQATWVGGAEHRRLVTELGFVTDAVQGPAAAASQ